MKVIALIFIIAITMALSISLTMRNFDDGQEQHQLKSLETETDLHEGKLMPSKRLSRFLAANHPKNPRAAALRCRKNDNETCYKFIGKKSTCCNNKCIDLGYDQNNCGACKNKCLVTESCCNGECVDLSYDKRHCGHCNNRCMPGGYCIYGICDYA